jgi:hypothetical protein
MKDDQKLCKVFDSLFANQNQINMQILHRDWFRNVLYYLGEQWFEWVRGQKTFRRLMPSPYLPTPVANIIRDFVRSMKALCGRPRNSRRANMRSWSEIRSFSTTSGCRSRFPMTGSGTTASPISITTSVLMRLFLGALNGLVSVVLSQ